MSDSNDAPSGRQDTVADSLLNFWSKCIEQNAEQTEDMVKYFRGESDLPGLRRMWLESLSKSLDTYMRSPAFLQTMQRNLETAVQMHSLAEGWARGLTQSTSPQIPDPSGIFKSLLDVQQAILDRLSAIEKRLAALEKQAEK